jgi:hypothetical protein
VIVHSSSCSNINFRFKRASSNFALHRWQDTAKPKKLTDAELWALKAECTRKGLLTLGTLLIPYEKIAAYGGEGIAWLTRAASAARDIEEIGAVGELTGRFYSTDVLTGMLAEEGEGTFNYNCCR